MLAIVFLLIHLLFALFVFFLTIAFVTGAPFVPSIKKLSRKALRMPKIPYFLGKSAISSFFPTHR